MDLDNIVVDGEDYQYPLCACKKKLYLCEQFFYKLFHG